LKEQQEYLVAGLPSVSNVLSRRLLERFKTPKRVFNAKEAQLIKVPKIGEEKARKIRTLLDSPYKTEK
ncbi:MAG: helix-hairpin-helix domain-containing protein, partial [Candidatus Aenigmatarchaeota archaeon]